MLGNKEGWAGFTPKTADQGIATHVFAAFSPDLKGMNQISHIAKETKTNFLPLQNIMAFTWKIRTCVTPGQSASRYGLPALLKLTCSGSYPRS